MNCKYKFIYCIIPLICLGITVYFSSKKKEDNTEFLKELILNRKMLDEISDDLWSLKKRVNSLEKEYMIDITYDENVRTV